MDWLVQTWLLIVVLAVLVWMHASGHGCGSHGCHARHDGETGKTPSEGGSPG